MTKKSKTDEPVPDISDVKAIVFKLPEPGDSVVLFSMGRLVSMGKYRGAETVLGIDCLRVEDEGITQYVRRGSVDMIMTLGDFERLMHAKQNMAKEQADAQSKTLAIPGAVLPRRPMGA